MDWMDKIIIDFMIRITSFHWLAIKYSCLSFIFERNSILLMEILSVFGLLYIPVKIFQWLVHEISESCEKNYKKSDTNYWINDGKKLSINSFWENVSITNCGHNCNGKKQCFLKCPIIIPSVDVSIVVYFFDTFYNVSYQVQHCFFCL